MTFSDRWDLREKKGQEKFDEITHRIQDTKQTILKISDDLHAGKTSLARIRSRLAAAERNLTQLEKDVKR